MAHAAYVLNVATPDAAKWERAAAGLAKELERACTLGLGLLCFHPGAATDGDRDAALARVARAMTQALAATDGPTRLMVENTAGAGTTVGRTPDEVAGILAGIPAPHRARAGYGLDTCHLYASGYDLARDAAAVGEVLDAFETATGEPPGFFHLNDSEGALGSNRDRHRLIGEGAIGEAAFGWLLADRRSRGVPLVLETPHAVEEPGEDDDAPDPHDVRMLALLRRLAPAA
jgi:deoxyribonuclease-4